MDMFVYFVGDVVLTARQGRSADVQMTNHKPAAVQAVADA